jgi:phosphopantothenoylcysteine decarboxylase/phosphopantothenate--cysteine ligase
MTLKGKKILLGITGGIAAYKCPLLAREWTRAGARVDVVMTGAAGQFVTKLTMETVSGQPVHTQLFPQQEFSATIHIDLADNADVLVIAPATANFIGKLRAGLADDLLSTVAMAGWRKIMLVPAMNSNMWANPAVQENLAELQQRGMLVVPPDSGDLACGYTGVGRMPDPEIISYWLHYFLHRDRQILVGRHVLITAGRTEESFDPVRIMTNRSSGKMGFALARQAFFAGAKVSLVAGPNSLTVPQGVDYYPVTTATEMDEQVQKLLTDSNVFIASAAVSDFRPKEKLVQKLKKKDAGYQLELESTPDVLARAGKDKKDRLHVGFAVETETELQNARDKMDRKNLDLIIVNNPTEAGAGFATDTNIAQILDKAGNVETLPLMSKDELAARIMERIAALYQEGNPA